MILNFILMAILIVTVAAMIILSTKYDKKVIRNIKDVNYLVKVDKAIEVLMWVFVLALCGLLIVQYI